MKKRIFSLFTSLIMVLSLAVVMPAVTVGAAGGVKSKLDSFISRYPSGSRWTSSFDGGKQCYGFAKLVIYNIFGASNSGGYTYRTWRYNGTPTSGMEVVGSITNYSSSNVKSLLSKAKCGDVLQFDSTKQHSMIIYSIESDGVRIYDCNWDNNCGISLRKCSFGAWSGRNSNKLTLLRSNNYSSIDGVAHTVNSNYSKNFTAYPKAKITASNIFNENHRQISSTAWIGTSDKCTIHEVYTDGCCKVTYPLSSGGTKTVYSKISLFNHTHSYNTFVWYEAAHPHYKCYKCSCGDVQRRTSETTYVSSCTECNKPAISVNKSSVTLGLYSNKSTTISVTTKGNYDHINYTSSTAYCTVDNATWSGNVCTFTITATDKGSTTIGFRLQDKSNNNLATVDVPVTVKGHSFGSWTTTKSATCTTDGLKTRKCSSCGKTETQTIAKTGHSYTTKVVAPTCTAQGYTLHTCSKCGTSYKDTYTNVKGHSFGSWTITKSATCTTDGSKTRKCSSCGKTETQTITKTGHSYTTKVVAPTCTAQGYTLHTCSKCGTSYKDTYKNAKGHSFGSWTITKSATCTTDGSKTRKCSSCGKTETQTITKIGHKHVATVVEPTCIEGGYTIHICVNCEESYIDQYISATGHQYVNTVVKPTYTAQGYTLHKCSVCGASYKDNYKAKLVLGKVSNLKASSNKTNSVKLSWNKVSGASGYYVYQQKDGKWSKIKTTSSTSYTVPKLKSGKTYKFAIKAYKTVGDKKVASEKYSSTLTTSTLPATVNFKVTAGSKKATVKWSKVTGATGYKVYYKTSKNGSWKLLKTTNNKTTSYTKTGLTKGKTYYFTVKAYRTVSGKTYNGSYTTKSLKIK